MTKNTLSIDQLVELQGQALGSSQWMTIDQSMINTFADVTQDHQFIHVDEEAARQTPFGGTIAHGFLTLSLLSAMAAQVLPTVQGQKSGVNYGINNLRFISPVHSGKRVRGHFHLKNVSPKNKGSYQLIMEVTIEIEDEAKPALVTEWLTLVNV
ncbi:MaoC family dehydratase [Acinetobacter sp. P1(2023)]|uniref:MaoC family dehydratase n=1 Tax=unclassified Acinetobacter TaxID=196816 RepID=UPI0021CD8CD7|nr:MULTISPECIES: MaoC family dehydratase [unclassified Acinetobacter]MCU4531515.1 MaoC family dehydratase [Acinetobacter sp. WU_MDCI_Abxe169]MDC0843581.1 MaoC family dehydratase [Acinetobacter sp. P1(2023)]